MYLKVKETLDGNTEAFGDIVKEYEKNIYNYLYRLCGSRDEAMDLVQETFLKAYKGLGKLKSEDGLKPWIYRIAHNSFIDYIRSRKEYEILDEDMISDEKAIEDTVILRDTAKIIDGIITGLPYKYKSVFMLRAIEGLSFNEIGCILKISENTAKTRYLRARRKIGNILNGGDLL